MTNPDPSAGGSAKVPLVSEVLDRLLAIESGARTRRSALFQAALQVCTDEIRRVKQGATPAALDTLVERARTLLTSPAGQMRAAPSRPSVAADLAPLLDETAGLLKVPPTVVSPEPPAPPMPAARPTPEAPPPSVPPKPAAAPPPVHPKSEAVPPPTRRDPFVVAPEEAPPVPAAAEPWPPPPPAVSFLELFPPPEPALEDLGGKTVPGSRLGTQVLLPLSVLIVVGGAAAWYFLIGPRHSLQTVPTPAPTIAPVTQPPATVSLPTALPAIPPPPPTQALAIQTGGSTPGAKPGVPSAAAPASASPTSVWDLTTPPTAPPNLTPGVEPTPPAPPPARPPQHAPARAAAPPAQPGTGKAPPSGQDRAATMVSPDWAGHAPIYVVHFSSYHDHDKAASDAARIAAEFRHPTYVAKVSLGAEGEWFRVVVGDFATADEAFAYRAELLARHVPDVAHVYRLTAPK
ncbi:MAG: SPOR domain-containing protein [Thermoanaerobaculales bacterium]